MASSNNRQTFGLLLQCALCNEELVNKQPKSLPCLHTFCTQCLTYNRRQFIENDNILCPVCHTSAGRLLGHLEITHSLQVDVIVEKLLKVRRLQQSNRHCEMCTEGGVASHWCQDCSKLLCDSCLVHHGRYKPKDKVIDVSQGVDIIDKPGDFMSPTKCLRHEKKLKMYCVQCEICLCSTCSLEHRSDKNANCVPVSIEKVAPDTKVKGQRLLNQTFAYLTKEKKEIDDIKVKNDDLKREFSAKSEEIWEHMEETVRRLKENARDFILELEAETKKQTDELEKMIQLRQNHVSKIEIIDNNFRQLLQSFDNVDILLNFSRLKSKRKNLLTKTKKDSNNLHGVNMAYNNWYLKAHEMSKNIPLARCWKDSELIEGATASNRNLITKKKKISNMPPVPSLCYPFKIEGLIDKELREAEASCLFVTDAKHILVGGAAFGTLHEYTASNVKRGIYVEKRMKYCNDICSFSSDKICVVDGNLILFQINQTPPFLTFFKHIIPDVKYYSICNCFGEILVCDYNCGVHLLTDKGTVDRTVLGRKRSQSSYNIIRRGPFKGTFLLFDCNDKTLFCYRLFDSKCLFSLKVGYICDLCTDEYGNIFVVDKEKIYVLNPDASKRHNIFSFVGDSHVKRLFVKDNAFYFLSDVSTYNMRKFDLDYDEVK